MVLNILVVVPENVTLLLNTTGPVTNKLPPIPTPPATYNALFCTVAVLDIVLVIVALDIDKVLVRALNVRELSSTYRLFAPDVALTNGI